MSKQETYRVEQTSSGRTMGSTFLVKEFDKVGFGTTTFVCFALFVVLGEEFDSRETRDSIAGLQTLVLLVICVNIGDDALDRICKGLAS